MTTPSDYGTVQGIVGRGMLNSGLLGKGKTPTSWDYADGINRINGIAYLWQTQGIKLWLQQDYALQAPILQVGVNFYTFGPMGTIAMVKPTRLVEDSCYFQDSFGNRRPLIPMSRNEYNTLSVVTQQGAVNSFYVDKQQYTLNVYLWLTPDLWTVDNGAVHLILQNQITTVTQITDTMSFPLEWAMALEWALADQICTGQPQAIMDRCATMAQSFRMALEAWDVEDTSIVMQPDPRSQYVGNKFT
jgi:hypothetical protein